MKTLPPVAVGLQRPQVLHLQRRGLTCPAGDVMGVIEERPGTLKEKGAEGPLGLEEQVLTVS